MTVAAAERPREVPLAEQRWVLPSIVLLAIVIRLAALLLWPAEPVSDARWYEEQAWRVARGLGYTTQTGIPTAFYPPLYAFFVAGLYALVGRQPLVVYVVQATLSALISLAIFDVVQTLWRRRTVAVLSALLVAVDLPLVLYPRLFMTETLFAFLLALAMVAWARAWRTDHVKWWALFGVALGSASLTRPPIQLLPLLALALWPLGRCLRPHRTTLRRWLVVSTVVLGTVGLTLLPWIWRNARAFGRWTPQITSSTGNGLYISYFPRHGWLFGAMDMQNPQWNLWAEGMMYKNEGTLLSEWQRNAFITHAMLDYLAAHPWAIIRLVPVKLLYLLWPYDWALFNGIGRFDLTYAFAAPFIVVGLVAVVRTGQWSVSAPLWLIVLYMVGISVVFLGAPRFRMPVHPYLHAFAALGLWSWTRRDAHWRRWLVAWSGGVVGLGFVWVPLKEAVGAALRMTGSP